ncbi:MAG: prephenate dehydratase [Candidatus Nitrosocaldaceae archaeon]|nr:MAG: prephenate dehydratase [Candidatus Nitrosocaldaceae archaeon]
MKVAFQGERGAYSEIAALKYFDNPELIPKKTLVDVFDSVGKEVDYAVVPVENSLEGSVNEAYDLLLTTDLTVIGEVYVRIIHCLISYEDNTIEDIKRVYSHPQALGQCKGFINAHRFEVIPYYDTAGSVKMLANNIIKDAAAIASRRAAEIYNMKILAESIEDDKNNYTRFLILGREHTKPTGNDKTMIIFATKHAPGALYDALGEFALRNINLTMIISRPIKGKPWEYNFYLDFEGHVDEPNIKECLDGLKHKTSFLKILGSYPRAKIDI